MICMYAIEFFKIRMLNFLKNFENPNLSLMLLLPCSPLQMFVSESHSFWKSLWNMWQVEDLFLYLEYFLSGICELQGMGNRDYNLFIGLKDGTSVLCIALWLAIGNHPVPLMTL